jgi:hypothetical protein
MPDEIGTGAVGTIEGLLVETRRFPPPPEFAAQANVNDPSVCDRARQDPEGFWASIARDLEWISRGNGHGVESPLGQVVRRRQAERVRQLCRSTPQGRAAYQGSDHLGR